MIIKKINVLIILSIILLLFGCSKDNKFNEDGLTFEYDKYLSELEDKFYFKQLSDEQKKIYMCLYDASTRLEYSFEYNFPYVEFDHQKAYDAFLYDWPEYFWWASLDNTIGENSSAPALVSVSDYLYKESIKEDYESMNSLIDQVINKLEGESDYDKLKSLHDYMIDNYNINNDYFSRIDDDSQEYYSNNNIFKLLKDKDGTSDTYAFLFKVICSKLGYDCICVMPSFNSYTAHNLIMLDDKYYYVDVAYDDYIAEDSNFELDKYMFFLANKDIELAMHANNISFVFPNDVNNDDYYFYNMAGKYFKIYDEKEVDNFVVDCIKKKNKEIILVFNNSDDCQSCYDHYFSNKLKGFYDLYAKRINSYYNITVTYSKSNCNYVIFSFED